MKFGVLGPVRAGGGQEVPALTPMVRSLLAVLLVEAGRPVSEARLTEALWGGSPPQTSKAALQNHVLGLRRALGVDEAARVRRTYDGYLIEVEAGELDLREFEQLSGEGSEDLVAGRWQAAADALTGALALWRGDPLADALPATRDAVDVGRIHEARLQTVEQLARARLELGHYDRVIGEIEPLLREHPWREAMHGQLMHALHGAGRQAEALTVYQRLRTGLVTELGVEPSAGLADLHRRILAGDPALIRTITPAGATQGPSRVIGAPDAGQSGHSRESGESDHTAHTAQGSGADSAHGADHRRPQNPDPRAADAANPVTPANAVIPRQLPAKISHFTGRTAALAVLEEFLAAAGEGDQPLIALVGTAGVGKTALAVHWAHRIAYRYPDGCLYVNLRGFDPSQEPVTPEQAIRGFLQALGLPRQELPALFADQVGRYRSLAAERRLLIVLDNARDAEQVRELLPGNPACLTLVTSRDRLTGLVAVDGARPLRLDTLPADEAFDLLARRLGGRHAAEEPDAIREIAELCARLPLALNIAAARIATNPHLPIEMFVQELREAGATLRTLDAGDRAASVRTVFSWSYRQLGGPAARLFRLLGVHPGPDLGLSVCSALTARPRAATLATLEELTGLHLLDQHAPGRYVQHDLLRVFAGELGQAVDGRDASRDAELLTLDHYLHSAFAAERLLQPARPPIALAPPHAGSAPLDFADLAEALRWYDAEYPVLLAAARRAGAVPDPHAWQLPWSMVTYLDRAGLWHDLTETLTGSLAALRRIGDIPNLVAAHMCLAQVLGHRLNEAEAAETHFQAALDLDRETDDATTEVRVMANLMTLRGRQGRWAESVVFGLRALKLLREKGETTVLLPTVLNKVGWSHVHLGRYEEALACSTEALELFRETGFRIGQADALDTLGLARHRLGDTAGAVACYEAAEAVFIEVGERFLLAETLMRLGDVHLTDHAEAAAREVWTRSLAILSDIGHPTAEQVEERLRSLDR
ncbi:transcriptional regulator, SARP family [Catenulispora acidiphila DSM 44928]|uniref:Transcriptional regulator, SARP family n=1 Tax=Catenulispora acidiphila (strain DSM 44928 / JCM 14897 / NBRC 102108 / NRRL B-24433 / ID139908) TaxID=479433 RepID=C7Q4V1_CATAD|nr:BTAD domain-containing putative transcriptional regulator [Catenulispora acidiphila]ACU73899.1 transcriptional regulator, SARP family [Catenulispora acidiphila DSM 44928]